MRPDDKHYTDLDLQLQQLALIDWSTFVKLIGDDAILNAKICMLRSRGDSMVKISNKFSLTKRKVQIVSEKKCDCIVYGNILRYENKKT